MNNSPADVSSPPGSPWSDGRSRSSGSRPAPLLLGYVLGRLMEENLRRALAIARGDARSSSTRPISAALLAVAIVLVLAVVPSLRKKRDEVFVE